MAFGEKEREELIAKYEADKSKKPSGWDAHLLKGVASQAGSYGERAREIFDRKYS